MSNKMFESPDSTLDFHNKQIGPSSKFSFSAKFCPSQNYPFKFKNIADIAMGQRCKNKAKSSAYILTSPLGHVYTNACPDGLHCVRLYGDADYDKIEWDTKVDFIRGSTLITQSNPHAKRLKKWLQAYFDNAPRCEEIELDLCCLDLYGDFNSNIWKNLRDHCPPGQLISYSELARKAGLSAGASKVVGYAINKNPFSLVVGDHRVVTSKGEIVWCDDSQRNKLRRLLVDHEISFLDNSNVEAELAKVRDRCKTTAGSRKRAVSTDETKPKPKAKARAKSKASSKVSDESEKKPALKRKKTAPAKKGKRRKKEETTSEEEDNSISEDSDA